MGLALLDTYEKYTTRCNIMSTYLGIPHPSALILQFKWASLGAKSTQNGERAVFRESDVFGFVGKVILGSSQKTCMSL